MKTVPSERFRRSFAAAPRVVQTACDKQLGSADLQFSASIVASQEIRRSARHLAGRVNRGWRFYFKIEDDTFYLIDVMPHPK